MKVLPRVGSWSKGVGCRSRQIRFDIKAETRMGAVRHKQNLIILPRKTSMEVLSLIVPQTDTGRRGEYPKVLERTVVKELGKIAP